MELTKLDLHESWPQKNADRPVDARNIGEVACEFTVPMENNFVELKLADCD